MPELDSKANKNNVYAAISYDYCPPENLQIIDRRTYVTARWLSSRFKITYTLICHVIAEIEQYAHVIHDGSNLWIDDAAFVEICNHPSLESTFDEAARGAVLQLLGHYRDMGEAA
jgi:hypothetical protein